MATTATPNPPGSDSSSSNSVPLAEAEAIEQIQFKGENAELRTVVSVQACPIGSRSRLGYHANLFLTPSNGEEKEIGWITAWRISKPTGVNRNINGDYYRDEWLRAINRYDEDSKETAYCMKALSREAKKGRMEGDKQLVLGHEGHEFVFIQMLYIKWREDPDDEQTGVSFYGSLSFLLGVFLKVTDMHCRSTAETASLQGFCKASTEYWAGKSFPLGSA